jgi:hypothetical protein
LQRRGQGRGDGAVLSWPIDSPATTVTAHAEA